MAARNVWGKALKLKVEDYPTIKVHVARGADVLPAAREAMLKIWHAHRLDQRLEKPELRNYEMEEMDGEIFKHETAVIWFSTVDLKGDIQAFCVVEPETEQAENGLEDVVWLLHLHARPDYEKFDFQAPMIEAVTHYCQAAGIRKNVTITTTPHGSIRQNNCTNEWIKLIKHHGFKKSSDGPGADSDDRWKHIRRWERIIPAL